MFEAAVFGAVGLALVIAALVGGILLDNYRERRDITQLDSLLNRLGIAEGVISADRFPAEALGIHHGRHASAKHRFGRGGWRGAAARKNRERDEERECEAGEERGHGGRLRRLQPTAGGLVSCV